MGRLKECAKTGALLQSLRRHTGQKAREHLFTRRRTCFALNWLHHEGGNLALALLEGFRKSVEIVVRNGGESGNKRTYARAHPMELKGKPKSHLFRVLARETHVDARM